MRLFIIFISCVFLLSFGYFTFYFLGILPNNNAAQLFIVKKTDAFKDVHINLEKQGFIKYSKLFTFAAFLENLDVIAPGGYSLQKDMAPWTLAAKLKNPDYNWVTIPPGKRKEEIGEILSTALHWDKKKLDLWNNYNILKDGESLEGELFPDTYLLPNKESPMKTANRIISHFNTEFASYQKQFTAQNIRWTTALKIASLIQREAAGSQDMALISGILWNRLNIHMPLQIDATIQYIKGKNDKGQWWTPISPKDIKLDSPYNTYEHSGLPPTPICSPGLSAISAVLKPQDTNCLYYLHDSNREIHCAQTYQEHLLNINKYLVDSNTY